MKRSMIITVTVIIAALGMLSVQAFAQRVCGDPTARCASRGNFEPFELPFETGKRPIFFESAWFYGIILKTEKMAADWGDCEHPIFGSSERLETQALFPKNKVFTLSCVQPVMNYYAGMPDHVAYIGVYAGKTRAAANTFLKQVKATGKFPNAKIRRMRAIINGT